jgi:SAM-dependent methyltransferase
VCSEVLEHMQDDKTALKEIARVMKDNGSLVLTFPHRHFYFSFDDRYVGHIRRYELSDMADCLQMVGLRPTIVKKILGPLEKITMIAIVQLYKVIKSFKRDANQHFNGHRSSILFFLFIWSNRLLGFIMSIDAFIMPRCLSTVLLIKARKDTGSTK